MNFICIPCRSAADAKPDGLLDLDSVKKAMHEQCQGGTHCDCQHRVRKSS